MSFFINMPPGLDPQLYQILSKYSKVYGSYGAYKQYQKKNSFYKKKKKTHLGEKTTKWKSESCHSKILHKTPTEPDRLPYQILSNYLKRYKSYEAHKNVSKDGWMPGWSLSEPIWSGHKSGIISIKPGTSPGKTFFLMKSTGQSR